MKQVRQGDVLLAAVDMEPPKDARKQREVILADGELTGHAHRLSAPEVLEWEVEGQRYVRVSGGPGVLSHEDHDPTPVPVLEPGATYRVIPQREYSLEGQWQKVVD